MKLRLLKIGRVARAKGPINQEKLKQRYARLLDTTSRVVGQALRFSDEIGRRVKRSNDILKQLALEPATTGLRRPGIALGPNGRLHNAAAHSPCQCHNPSLTLERPS